jgi:hypothetical protein
MSKTIEAVYEMVSSWEPKRIEGWPRDADGFCREIETAHSWWIEWDMLCVVWEEGHGVIGYEPTYEASEIDQKRPDKVYVGAVEAE